MATTQSIEMRINLRANTNRKSDYFGKLYPFIDRLSTLDTRGFINHVVEHGTMFDRPTIEGVMTTVRNCLVELLAEGVAVKFTGIGTFYPSAESEKGGADNLDDARHKGADGIVSGIHVRYLPDGTKLDDITSKTMKQKCTLRLHQLQEEDGTYTTSTGEVKKRYKFIPINQPDADSDDDDDDEPEP